jgi:DNA-binding IclR family transcriptional regulator
VETRAFVKALEHHQRWQRDNLPGVDTRQGMLLLIWLLKQNGQARPIGELYKAASMSGATMRDVVKLFTANGLLELDGDDSRRCLLRGTPKLRKVVEEYLDQVNRALAGRA